MAEQKLIQPMGPLQEGDQAIVDALRRFPLEASSVHSVPLETVVTDYTGRRETTPGLPKDHWSVACVDTDNDGNPETAEVTLVQVSSKDINVVLRGGSVADEIRTEEDKPKATDRAKIHDNDTEQSIKLLTAQRLNKAADTLLRIQGIRKSF